LAGGDDPYPPPAHPSASRKRPRLRSPSCRPMPPIISQVYAYDIMTRTSVCVDHLNFHKDTSFRFKSSDHSYSFHRSSSLVARLLKLKHLLVYNTGSNNNSNGLTLIPWSEGRSATWDVTVTDTVAASLHCHLIHSCSLGGRGSRSAQEYQVQ
jgi:hypothetical protein